MTLFKPQSSAFEETKSWLAKIFNGNAPTISNLDQESIEYLHRISVISRKRDEQILALISANKKQTAEYFDEGQKLENVLQRVNLSVKSMHTNVSSSLAVLSSSAVTLETNDASLASLCVALTDLESDLAKEETTHKYLQKYAQDISDAANSSGLRDKELCAIETETKALSTEAMEHRLEQAERLARQYAEASRHIKSELRDAGVADNIYHGRLARDADAVRTLHERLRPLRSRLAGFFDLPPDARLARAELQAARARLEEVERRLQDSIAAIVVGGHEQDL